MFKALLSSKWKPVKNKKDAQKRRKWIKISKIFSSFAVPITTFSFFYSLIEFFTVFTEGSYKQLWGIIFLGLLVVSFVFSIITILFYVWFWKWMKKAKKRILEEEKLLGG